ncbi:MAG: outer membrane beta-barrel protein [Bacteroidota bacterium]
MLRIIRYLALFISCWGATLPLVAQNNDSLKKDHAKIIFNSEDVLQLKGTQIANKIDSLLRPEFRIGGYVSTYYAYYDDESEPNGFIQFPTLAPRKDQFSLNMALISMQYKSSSLRSNITLHYGDVPASSWPSTFNLIQEANAGFKITKKLWFDAGFFRTHIGLESFQPRENIASSMSIPNFYDPYYLSGAKLTYMPTAKLNLQACIFNGYNEYIDNNRNKALDFSANYNPNNHISFTYNFLTCDETPDNIKTKHQRYYQNFYATFIYQKFTIGFDANFGIQAHSLKKDSSKAGKMYAGILVAKYNLLTKFDVYCRLEYFSDPNQILTNSLNTGRYVKGNTLGFEIKPQKTVGISAEWRILECDQLIFRQKNTILNQRNEFIVCLDLWF